MRIFVYGPPGAGKSTAALDLGDRLGLPVLHLDQFFFRGPDVHLSDREGLAALRIALPQGGWIVEGNHGAALEPIAGRAELVVVLDVPAPVRAWRILRRRVAGAPRLRRAVADGWVERVSWRFLWFALWRFPQGFERQVERIGAATSGEVHRVVGQAGLAGRPDLLRRIEDRVFRGPRRPGGAGPSRGR